MIDGEARARYTNTNTVDREYAGSDVGNQADAPPANSEYIWNGTPLPQDRLPEAEERVTHYIPNVMGTGHPTYEGGMPEAYARYCIYPVVVAI